MAWIGAAVAIGGALISSNAQADSAEAASDAQQQSSKASIEEQRREYDLARRDSAPYREAGTAAITRLRDLLGISRGSPGAAGSAAGLTGAGRALTGNDDLVINSGGVPAKNTELYVADPLYKAAWDNYEQAHIAQHGAYTSGSSAGAIEQGIREYMANPQLYGYAGPLPQPEAKQAAGPVDEYQILGEAPLTRKFTVADFYADPVNQLGLEFGLSEGRKGLDRMAGASGLRKSGQQLKALTRFGEDYAGTKAAESENRYKNYQDRVFNMFSGVAGTGQTATTNTSALGANTAQNIGNTLTAAGNARGAASIAGGNAWSNAFNTVGNWWNQQQTLDKILNKGNGGQSYNSAGTFTPYYTGYGASGDYQYG